MRKFLHWTVVPVALAMGVFLFVQRHVFAQPADEREGDREAIGAVLSAQQTVWNNVGVDAFLVGYWHSPELTFFREQRGGARLGPGAGAIQEELS